MLSFMRSTSGPATALLCLGAALHPRALHPDRRAVPSPIRLSEERLDSSSGRPVGMQPDGSG